MITLPRERVMMVRLSRILFILLFVLVSSFVTGCGIHTTNVIEEYNKFGVRSARMGLWNEAIMRWKHIIEIDPRNAKVHNNLGVAYESKGDFEAAMAEYKKAIELEPDNKIYMGNYMKFKRNYDRVSKKPEAKNE